MQLRERHGAGDVPAEIDGTAAHEPEQDADVVLFIYRESEYNDEVPIDRADDALIEVAKHRNGPTGKANLLFLKQYARFENHRGV